ncbi:MAG: Crp/Fnr family transcriptional regulator [Chloroflexi bacterium]|nr:Crp/Fnr family transcriptional regulator [Chloroflexota bacterium]
MTSLWNVGVGTGDWGTLAAAVLLAGGAFAILGGRGPLFARVAPGRAAILGWVSWPARRPKRTPADLHPPTQGDGPIASGEKHLLRHADILRHLSEEQIAKIASQSQLFQAPAGWVLGTAGERGHYLFIILRGKAQLSAHTGAGEITVRIAGPGESFPLAALVGSGNLITSASAMTDMELLAIPRTTLLELCAADPAIGMGVYQAMAEILAERYRKTLGHLSAGAERALKEAEFWVNM